MFNLKQGTMIAIAAGSLFAAACKKSETKQESAPTTTEPKKDTAPATTDKPLAPGEKTANVHCMGVNDCTGKGACKTPKNDCAGKNACKGQGFIDITAEDCSAKGGTVATNVGM